MISCSVCSRPDKDLIEARIRCGEPFKNIVSSLDQPVHVAYHACVCMDHKTWPTQKVEKECSDRFPLCLFQDWVLPLAQRYGDEGFNYVKLGVTRYRPVVTQAPEEEHYPLKHFSKSKPITGMVEYKEVKIRGKIIPYKKSLIIIISDKDYQRNPAKHRAGSYGKNPIAKSYYK